MGKMTGLFVMGRELFPGDEILWIGELMTVEEVQLIHGAEVNLVCRKADGTLEHLHGLWDSRATLITRKEAQYQDGDR